MSVGECVLVALCGWVLMSMVAGAFWGPYLLRRREHEEGQR